MLLSQWCAAAVSSSLPASRLRRAWPSPSGSITAVSHGLNVGFGQMARDKFWCSEDELSALAAGRGWGGRSLYGSQSQRAMRGASFSARASMNITCCANQTQTAQRKSYSGPTSPPSGSVKEKVKPRLDDGGVGFPPFRFGGGGGGGGGGGSSSSGGFILFVIVLLLDYLREFERNLQNGSRRGSDYDNGLAPQ